MNFALSVPTGNASPVGTYHFADTGGPRRLMSFNDSAGPQRLMRFEMTGSRWSAQLAPRREPVRAVLLNALHTKRLAMPLSVLVERDENLYLAQTIDFPLYGIGDTPAEAVDALKWELEALYAELMEDDNFSEEWLNRKNLLSAIVVPA